MDKHLERQLAESQALAHIGSWDWDVVTNELTWTDEHYRIWGLDPKTKIDLAMAMGAIHPADREQVQRIVDQSLQDGKPYRTEFRVCRPDGSERLVEARAQLEIDASGRPIRSYGTAQDVTERTRIAVAFERVEQRYREAVENAVEGVFRTTHDGRFMMANVALARMLGFETPQQLMSERIDVARQQYVSPEERARFVRLLQAQGIVRGFEYAAYRRDGSRIWLRVHARLVRTSDGTVFYEGTVQDVTNQHVTKQLLDLRAREQAAVARLGEAAISDRSLDSLFDCATSLIVETLDIEFSHILELRSSGDFVIRNGAGWPDHWMGSIVPGGARSQAGLALASERPIIMDDWGPELRQHLSPHLRAHGVVNGMSVIIGARASPYGVLGAHTASPRHFTIDDVNFLQGISSILAAAIVRLRGDQVREHLIARAISAHEEERTRIARELHDETGQALSAILVGLRNIHDAPDLEQTRVLSERLRDLTAVAIRDVGRIARGLRPTTLDDLGLVPALRRYADELAAARQIDISITHRGSVPRFRSEIETTLYRIIQEALTNVARHAHARRADVTIERVDGRVRATINDDGRGFDVTRVLHHGGTDSPLGLVGMQERASLLGGKVAVTSRPSGGVQIVVDLPVEAHV